ncbi:uncharacterized protein LOC126285250 [Schistocerca gregaria]|uniref:uncharacterized protein LOC126285250 n=1 Tax=Schistocerca gregaria TaxID=7010 RepID=UPI00211E0A13|nr:uncharacterized protein LOC126285250 [Schistocerca gregaria]
MVCSALDRRKNLLKACRLEHADRASLKDSLRRRSQRRVQGAAGNYSDGCCSASSSLLLLLLGTGHRHAAGKRLQGLLPAPAPPPQTPEPSVPRTPPPTVQPKMRADVEDVEEHCWRHSHVVLSEALVARLTGGDQFSALRQKFQQEDAKMEAQLACMDDAHTRRLGLTPKDFDKAVETVSSLISGVVPEVCQCQRRQLLRSLQQRRRDPLCTRWPVQRFYACVQEAQQRILQNPPHAS